MILDYNYLFDGTASASGALSAASMITSSGTTLVSTNVIDLVNARDMGVGDPKIRLMCVAVTAFTSTGAATLTVSAQGSTDNTTYTTYARTDSIIATSCTAGTKFASFDWPPVNIDSNSRPRYLRLTYGVGAANISAGTFISALVLGMDYTTGYPPGTTVSN